MDPWAVKHETECNKVFNKISAVNPWTVKHETECNEFFNKISDVDPWAVAKTARDLNGNVN